MIPAIPIEDLLRDRADAAITEGASQSGFLTLTGVDAALGTGATRQEMLGFFGVPGEIKAQVTRNRYDPSKPHVYRGYFPARPELDEMLEGYDIGPDILAPAQAGDGTDPLTEPTPVPAVDGWPEAVARYYAAMLQVGRAVTRALLRGIGVDEALTDRLFDRSISTLRLLHYPETEDAHFGEKRRVHLADGSEKYVMTGEHTDSGFVTLLWQDRTGGLQAMSPDGDWIDMPPAPDGLVVNFGQLLSDWSCGRIRATPHRVLGGRAERFSVPFFFEPAVDALIEPLFPGETPDAKSFIYGDFLWERMVRFPNFRGVERRKAG